MLRNKRYVGALQTSGGYLLLDALRDAQEIVEVGAVSPSTSRAPDKREIALAQQLIGAFEDRFDPPEFRNEYEEQFRGACLPKKAAGKVVRFPKAPPRKREDSLVASQQTTVKSRRNETGHGRPPSA